MENTDHRTRNRRFETGLAWFSLAALVVYVPGETWGAWGDLSSPGYIVDVIAMLLLLYGGVHSLRVRPRSGIAVLCGAWGFSACLAWRSYFTRKISRERGLGIYEDQLLFEQVLGLVLIVALVAFAFSLFLARSEGD